MKLKTQVFLAGIILTLFASTGHTGTINDSYATGDTLTATHLTNIKKEVNDNASNIAGLQSPSGSVSVHAANFQSEGVVTPCDWVVDLETGVRGFFKTSSNVGCDAVSGIQIPDGVIVSSLSCTFFHASPLLTTQHIEAKLLSINMASFSQGTIFQTPPTTNIGRQTTTDNIVNDTTPLITTIDNATNTYAVKIYFAEGNLDSQLTFVGCSVGYN